jgi:hypothetical protein
MPRKRPSPMTARKPVMADRLPDVRRVDFGRVGNADHGFVRG